MKSRTKRKCGNCTACCFTHPIEEIGKPAREWCPHCAIGKSCKIYINRPLGCREFECRWLLGEGMDSERPDEIGAVMDFMQLPFLGDVFALFEVKEGGLATELAARVTRENLNAGTKVLHLPLIGDNTLLMPEYLLALLPNIVPSVNGRRCNIIYRKSTI